MDASVLYVTLVGAFIAFVYSTYTTLRTLLPLLPGHPLNRRATTGAPTPPQEKRPRLKSAQRFTAYLATVDIFAATVLVVEVAIAVGTSAQLGGSRGAASRLYLATTARPTLLLVVALLSYTNVVLGRSITLGRADWIVWLPALLLYAGGAGLAAIPQAGSRNVWIGLCAWLTAVNFVVTLCFGRLLVAILRVRRITQHEQTFSRFAHQQSHAVSPGDVPYGTTLPTFRHNFSGISASFVNSIGRSTSTLHLPPPPDFLPYTSDTRPSISYAPSRASTEELDFDPARDFRSPTPGSAHLLLDRSTSSTPASYLSGRLTPKLGPRLPDFEDEHEVISFDGGASGGASSSAGGTARSRASLSSITSRASTYLAPGGFVGGANVRNALLKEAWGASTPPGTGHSPKVELSSREARGALVRIGGHLLCSLLSYALVSPFVFTRLLRPSASAPLTTSILLVLGVCQPGVILAWQCWASEGFWFRRPAPPVLTSSTALPFEKLEGVTVDARNGDAEAGMRERSHSRASTYKTWRSVPPGIQPDGADCAPTPRGTIGRALSMMATHPKLQVLPSATVEPASTTFGFVKSASMGHARLRSLKLSKATIGSFGELRKTARPRAGSSASRKTVGGFEHARRASAPVHASDQLIAMSLLRSRKPSADEPRMPEKARVPFGFGGGGGSASRSTLDIVGVGVGGRDRSCSPSPAVTPLDFHFSTRELSLSPTSSTFPASALPPLPSAAAPPTADHATIDYLSAHLLPQLVPSIKLGADVKIGPRDAPLPRRRSSIGDAAHASSSLGAKSARSLASFAGGSLASRRSRNYRGLSLPGLVTPPLPATSASAVYESWVAVDEGASPRAEEEEARPSGRTTPEAVLSGLRQVVRDSAAGLVAGVEERRRSWRGGDRSAQKWDAVEAAAREVEAAVDALGSSGSAAAPLPPPSHVRSASSGTRLDISFEWEEGATEVLEDAGTLADDSSSEDDDDDEAEAAALEAHQRARRRAAPLSPLSPLSPASTSFRPFRPLSPRPLSPHLPQRQSVDGSVILRGSQVASDDEEDVLTGTVHCATVHPVGRDSDSSAAEQSGWALRPTHIPVGSLNSTRSFASTNSSLITSEGFRNMLSGNVWHNQASDSGLSSDEQRSVASRRPLPIPPAEQRPLSFLSQRPLSFLSQRDGNASVPLSSDNDSEREMHKVARHERATFERDRSSRAGVPLPSVPPAIDELDEEFVAAGTPTPRARRRKERTPASAQVGLPNPPLAPSQAAAAAPLPSREGSAASGNDENADPRGAAPSPAPSRPLPLPPVGRPAARAGMRSFR
ncbi:hypothetical protein JCM10450v2_000586 [Rhodotorula kratochvilovae]